MHGVKYKSASVIRVLSDIHGFNYAVIVETIVLKNKEMMFAVKHLTVTTFHALLWAFEVQYSDEDVCLVPFSSLHCHGTLSLEKKRGKLYIVERNYRAKDLWSLF